MGFLPRITVISLWDHGMLCKQELLVVFTEMLRPCYVPYYYTLIFHLFSLFCQFLYSANKPDKAATSLLLSLSCLFMRHIIPFEF